MINFSIIILVLIAKCNANFEIYADDTLEEKYGNIIHASIVFRHGDRTPYAPYPLDPYKDYPWPEGYGHLTNVGKKRLYNAGKWHRKRYNTLVGEKYSGEDVFMQSSDVDRTLMSAACFLAGFYPPTDEEIWNEDLKWQPIPVHSIPLQQDNMIALFKPCDVYNNELFRANVAQKFKDMYKQNENFFNYVGLNTGILFSDYFIVYSLLKLMEVYDSLNVQNQNNFSLPHWSEYVFPEPMTSLAIKIFDIGTYTTKMKRLKAGPFLKSLRDDLNQKMDGKLMQNLHFYSGHDATIATIMITLDVFNNILPPYGSSLIFELREKGSEYFVTVLLKNSTDIPPFFIELPNCGEYCTLEKFLNVIEPLITEDWEAECQVIKTFSEKLSETWPFNQVQTLLLLFVIMFITTAMLYFYYLRNKTKFENMFFKRDKIKKK